MKNITTAFIFLLITSQNHLAQAEVSIRGKINGYDGKSIIYYHMTIEGIFTPYWKEVKPSADGTFGIRYQSEGFGNVRISYKSMRFRFFHDSNSKIHFEINEPKPRISKYRRVEGFSRADSVKQASMVSIGGDYEAINRFYNKNMRTSIFAQTVEGNKYSILLSKSESPAASIAILDSLVQVEVVQINKLPWRMDTEGIHLEKKDEQIKDFLTSEVQAFYGAVYINAMFLKRKEHVTLMMMDSSAKPNFYNRDWEIMVEKMKEEGDKIKPYPNSPDYLEFMETLSTSLSMYKQYNFPQNFTIPIDRSIFKTLFEYDTTFFRDDKTRFSHELYYLQIYLNNQLFFSPALLQAVNEIRDKHPNSENMKFYQPQIDKLKYSLETAEKEPVKAKIINARYKTLPDLIKRFEGKNLFIDVWATWCHPCIEEFSHLSLLHPYIQSGKLEALYISIDKEQWEGRWKQSIQMNGLEGNHFRADQEFIKQMWDEFGDEKGSIPRYVLIDKKGKIFRSTAARPSEGTALIRQVEELLNQ